MFERKPDFRSKQSLREPPSEITETDTITTTPEASIKNHLNISRELFVPVQHPLDRCQWYVLVVALGGGPSRRGSEV